MTSRSAAPPDRSTVDGGAGGLALPPSAAAALERLGTVELRAAGEVVFESGATGSYMYVIEEGAVDLLFGPGQERKRLRRGDHFGELALIVGDHRRTASAVAAEGCRLRVIGQPDFAHLLDSSPGVAVELLRATCLYLLDSERELVASLARRNRELSRTLDYLRRTREDLDARELEARTDGLTGLYNRRCLDEQTAAMVARATDGDARLILVLVDIDRFKLVNDRCGHPAGDEVLRAVARVLRSAVRQVDLPCRIGGDEFAILAADLDEPSARSLTQRLLETVRLLRVPGPDGEIAVTCSIGVARARPGEAWDELLARADAGLYRAKEGGRDRAEWA